MEKLGQPTPTIQLNETSKRRYTGLADYAERQGAPVEAFIQAGWRESTHFCRTHVRNRPAFDYPTATGSRQRYRDGLEPRHDSPYGYQMCWYGLEQALTLSPDVLILVNGAPGVVAAQWFGIPAFCISGGESAAPKPDMLEHLRTVAAAREIIVAYDCDTTGKKQAAKRIRQLIDAGFIARAVDLQLGKNGDFADFRKLHGDTTLARLDDLPEIPPAEPQQTRIYLNTGDEEAHRDEYERMVAVELERRAGEMKGKHFHCVKPNHADQHQSARVGKGRYGANMYYCTCGTYRLSTVATWLGLPSFRQWLKDAYPGEHKPQSKTARRAAIKREKRAVRARINGEKSVKVSLPSLPPFTADSNVNLPDMRQLDRALIKGKQTIVIKSATGGYKTGLIGQLINELPETASVFVLTHRVALVKDISKRFEIPDYKKFNARMSKGKAIRVVSTIDSSHLWVEQKFNLVVIDESTQGLLHLINAGTLKGKAAHTLEVVEQLLRDADCVICADANNNDTFTQWLKELRPDVFTIENTYRPTRANTLFLPTYGGAVQMAVKQVGQGEGVVLIPCASQNTARKMHKLLAKLYPDKRGRIISSRNSQTTDVQEFLATINDDLPTLDWLVYTSSMGTGVNIHCPVAAVVGIAGQPVAPSDFMQMLGRARNAEKRFVYAPECAGGGETDAQRLLDNRLRAVRYSGYFGTPKPDSGVYKLAQLEAIHTAQQNREMATYRDYLAAYLQADGSAPGEANQQPSRATLDTLKLITEEMAAVKKQNTLTLQPISKEAFKTLRESGVELTDEIVHAHERFRIERLTGMTITPAVYDKLDSIEKQHRFKQWMNLVDDEQALIEFDRQQADERRPLHQRRNATASRRVFLAILNRAFGISHIDDLKTAMVSIPRDELAQRVGFIGDEYRDELTALFGWRADGHDAGLDNPVGLFRWLCARYFIKFESKRIRQGDKLTYAYSIDASEFDENLRIARAGIAARLAEKNEMFQKREDNTMLSRVFGTTPEQGEIKHISPADDRSKQVNIAAIDAVLKSGKPVNPFAKRGAA